MQNSVDTQEMRRFISTLLTSRIGASRFTSNTPGLGTESPSTKKKNILSLGANLRRNSSQLLSQLNPNYPEDLKKEYLSGNSRNKKLHLDEQMKAFIKSFEKDPNKHEALVAEFQKRAPFISHKLDKTIGNASQKESIDVAQKTLENEIKRCKAIVNSRFERENILLETKQNQGITVQGREIEATIDGRGTGMGVTIYETQNLDQAHRSMQTHYADMSKARFDNLGTAVNLGTITPAALMDYLIDQGTHHNYDLASHIGVTGQLKELSVSRFNHDRTRAEKITAEIKNKLTDYLNITNGRTQAIGQSLEQNISQQHHQGINFSL